MSPRPLFMADFAVVAKSCARELELLLIFLKMQVAFKVSLCIFETSGRSLQGDVLVTLVDVGHRQL